MEVNGGIAVVTGVEVETEIFTVGVDEVTTGGVLIRLSNNLWVSGVTCVEIEDGCGGVDIEVKGTFVVIVPVENIVLSKFMPSYILHVEIPNLPELDDSLELAHLNSRVFVNKKKNHSRSTISGRETPLFLDLMGFSDVESGAESSSSGSSSSESSYDADNNDDNEHDGDGDNAINDDVIFETEDLNTTQYT
ncbi:hypothetical protein L1987_43252 [Smallanthus sonchifolius]|uniref:Uncharacterized protein n=1 Tax=Smallanthus sonchifolius TaxID=185202 RepID=A0ACB9GM67_9ASTR|nr:hypothetical protein L1987_43252 [Smallanthus sonchifolius]